MPDEFLETFTSAPSGLEGNRKQSAGTMLCASCATTRLIRACRPPGPSAALLAQECLKTESTETIHEALLVTNQHTNLTERISRFRVRFMVETVDAQNLPNPRLTEAATSAPLRMVRDMEGLALLGGPRRRRRPFNSSDRLPRPHNARHNQSVVTHRNHPVVFRGPPTSRHWVSSR